MANTPEDRMTGFPNPLICTCPDRHGPPDPKCPIHTSYTTDEMPRDANGMIRLAPGDSIELIVKPGRLSEEDHDYDVRLWALDAASRVYAGGRGGNTYVPAILEMAKKFEEYLRNGT